MKAAGRTTFARAILSSDRTCEVTTGSAPRTDKVDDTGVVTLRVNGRLRHIGIGRIHARTHVLLLIHDLQTRLVDAATGELLRELTPRLPTHRTTTRTHPKNNR